MGFHRSTSATKLTVTSTNSFSNSSKKTKCESVLDWPLFPSHMLATGWWWPRLLLWVSIYDLLSLCWLSSIDLALLSLTRLAPAQLASGLATPWVTMPCVAVLVERELRDITTCETQSLTLQLLLG